jgi:hypothetical protein
MRARCRGFRLGCHHSAGLQVPADPPHLEPGTIGANASAVAPYCCSLATLKASDYLECPQRGRDTSRWAEVSTCCPADAPTKAGSDVRSGCQTRAAVVVSTGDGFRDGYAKWEREHRNRVPESFWFRVRVHKGDEAAQSR